MPGPFAPQSALRLISPERATALDTGEADLSNVHLDLAAEGFYARAVPVELGGDGAPFVEAVRALADLAGDSLTAAFAAWCQRTCIHYLAHTGDSPLRASLLPELIAGERAGATGLSNAMKHLAGLEDLRLRADLESSNTQATLSGDLPWASNLVPSGFDVAIAAQCPKGRVIVALVPSELEGVTRSEDLPLSGMLGSSTASVKLREAAIPRDRVLSFEGAEFLSRVRPGFVLLQTGLGLGLARRSLEDAAEEIPRKARILSRRLHDAIGELESLWHRVEAFSETPDAADRGTLRGVFETRVRAMRLAVKAAGLELEASGGLGYFRTSPTSRRLREAAFLPVLTPSLVQLETQLSESPAV